MSEKEQAEGRAQVEGRVENVDDSLAGVEDAYRRTRAILDAISRYADAWSRKDIAAVRALRPGLSATDVKKIEESFQFLKKVNVQIECQAPQVAGDSATAGCRKSDRFVAVDGQEIKSDSEVTIHLRRQDAGWVIDSIQ